MPFSFLPARCIYVARQDVIRRIFTIRATTHLALFSSVKGIEFANYIF